MTSSKTLRGVFLALLAGTCWGFSGTVGQFLFTTHQVDSGWLTVVRMLVSGLILLVWTGLQNPRSLAEPWKDRRQAVRLIVFSLAGLMAVQYAYMVAIFYSNAGTATAIQYLGDAFILLYACCSARRLPRLPEMAELALALAGVFLLATHGRMDSMVLSFQGLFWGLCAAVALMLYTLLPAPLIRVYGSRPITGFGMLIGGVALALVVRPWEKAPALDMAVLVSMAAIILIGTVLAFTAYLKSVSDLGGVKAGLLASVETLAAPLFAALWLDTRFVAADFVGFFCILAMVVLLSLPGLQAEKKAGSKQ